MSRNQKLQGIFTLNVAQVKMYYHQSKFLLRKNV